MSVNKQNSQSDISFIDESDVILCPTTKSNPSNNAHSSKVLNFSGCGETKQTKNILQPAQICLDGKDKCSTVPNIIIPGSFQFIDDANCKPWTTPDPPCENIKTNKLEQNEFEDLSPATMVNSANGEKRCVVIPSINIPGSFDFIDDTETFTLTFNSSHPSEDSLCSKSETQIPSPAFSDSQVIFKIPSIYLPSNLEYIDDLEYPHTRTKNMQRGNKTHSSLKIPKGQSSKRPLCRYHSDSETKTGDTAQHKPRQHRSRSRKVRRSISAIETNKNGYKPRVRRSVSDRSGMIIAGKHLHPPHSRSRPHSHYENGSSRCSSTKTLSTNVSISEIVAVEMGYKDIPGLTAKEARRRRVVCTVMIVFITILVLSVLLIAVTLLLSPAVDAVLRKGNEEIYRSMGAGASTSSPTTEGAAVVANNSAPPSGSPG